MDSNSTYHHIGSGLSISISHCKHLPLGPRLLFILLILLLKLPSDKLLILGTILNHMSLLLATKASFSLFVAWLTPMFLSTSRTNHIWILCSLLFILISSGSKPFLCLVAMKTITRSLLRLLFLVLMKLFIILLYNKRSIHIIRDLNKH